MAQETEVHVDRNKDHLFCDSQMEEPPLNQIHQMEEPPLRFQFSLQISFPNDSLTPPTTSIVITPVARLQSGQQPDPTGQTSKRNAEEEARIENIGTVRCQHAWIFKKWNLTA